MAKFVERGHIDKLVTSDNVLPKRPKLDSHEPLQEVLNTSKVTKEVAEILAPLETSNDPQFVFNRRSSWDRKIITVETNSISLG